MTTAQEIVEMFDESIRRGQQERLEKSGHADPKEIHVTDIVRFTTYCARQVYYDKTLNRPPTVEAQVRYNFGHAIHETPINPEENEQDFEHLGVKCRMDDIDSKKGWIADKKSVTTIPKAPSAYVTKQLNIYKYIAEHNELKPFKVNDLFVLSISIYDGSRHCLPVEKWNDTYIKSFIISNKERIEDIVENRFLPPISKGWWCKSCQYPDVCAMNYDCVGTPKAETKKTTFDALSGPKEVTRRSIITVQKQ